MDKAYRHIAVMCGRRIYTGCWWEGRMARDLYKGTDVCRMTLKWIFEKKHGSVPTGLIWLKIEAGGEFL
jgi:hypothetical protein